MAEPSMQRVHKFGGAALATGADVARACAIVAEHGGERPVVVVSAHLGVTALLGEVAREAAAGRPSVERVRVRHRGLLRELELDPELVDRWIRELGAVLTGIAHPEGSGAAELRPAALGPRELDHVLSFGERLSARIVAAALRARGIEATPVDAFDLGLVSDGVFGRARPVQGVERDLRERLAEVPGVPVVTGFLAKDRSGRLTTLGRNGSDLTAAIVAEALGAGELVLWKSVPGISSADPRLVAGARTLEELSFDDALELARAGAEVLHPDAIPPVRRAGVALRVAGVQRPDLPGTRILERPAGAGPVAVVGREGLARIVLETAASELALGVLDELAARCGSQPAEARLLVARPGRIELWVDEAGLAGSPLEENPPAGVPGGGHPPDDLLAGARVERGLALVQIVGGRGPDAGRRALALLAEAGIAPLQTVVGGPGGGAQVFGVRGEDFARALGTLHETLRGTSLD